MSVLTDFFLLDGIEEGMEKVREGSNARWKCLNVKAVCYFRT